jgi:hypothetical protein
MIAALGRWLLLDLVLAALACAAGTGLVREVIEARPLPPVRALPAPDPRPVLDAGLEVAPPAAPAEYRVIAARNLFSASRGEAAAVIAPALAGPKPILHGVVLDGERSRAYLDDPVAQRVVGYAVGDPVAGGRLEQIQDDRVRIRQPGGVVEILLKDPSKPQVEPSAPAAPTRTRRAGARSASGSPGLPAPEPAAPPPAEPADPPAPEKVSP